MELLEGTSQAIIVEQAMIWRCIGELYEDKGDQVSAEAHYQKSLTLATAQLGKDSPRLAPILERLAKFYEANERLQKSIDTRWRILFLYSNSCFTKSIIRKRTIAALIQLYQQINDKEGVEAVQQFVENCATAN